MIGFIFSWASAQQPSKSERAFRREARVATEVASRRVSQRAPRAIIDCLSNPPPGGLHFGSAGRVDGSHVAFSQARHVIVRFDEEGSRTRITVLRRPVDKLAASTDAALDRCLA